MYHNWRRQGKPYRFTIALLVLNILTDFTGFSMSHGTPPLHMIQLSTSASILDNMIWILNGVFVLWCFAGVRLPNPKWNRNWHCRHESLITASLIIMYLFFSWIKNKHIIITYSYVVSRVGQKNDNHNQNNKTMAKPSGKTIVFDGLIRLRLQIVDAGSPEDLVVHYYLRRGDLKLTRSYFTI